ncbi:MAG: MATE family efflux transporter [Bacteroidetes bacterium]|nr:MATE family efflux transporter [Bacteroidota bacterium]
MKTAYLIRVSKLAFPIFAGLLSNTLVGVADTAFLGQVGAHEQSAGGYASLFYLVAFIVAYGLSIGLQIRIAQAFGAKNYSEIPQYFLIGLLGVFVYSLIFCALIFGLGKIVLGMMLSDPELLQQTMAYLQVRVWGSLWHFPMLTFYALLVGTENSKPIGIIYMAAAVLNVIFDYGFIFGNLGFPALGLQGAALATILAELLALFMFIWVAFRQKTTFFHLKIPPFARLRELSLALAHTSIPLILQNLVSMVSWFAFFTMVEKTGLLYFQWSVILRSIYGPFMMVGLGIGAATNSLTGQFWGEGNRGEIWPLLKSAALLAALSSMVVGSALFILEQPIALLFTSDPELLSLAPITFPVLFLGLVMFSVCQTLFNGLSGMGRTREALGIELVAVSVYLVYTMAVITYIIPHRIDLIWMAEGVYMLALGAGSLWFLVHLLKPYVRSQKTIS